MSDKYTYADVIIDPEDPRVEVGAEYYAANSISSALKAANEGNEGLLAKLDSVNREPTRTLITSESFTISYKHGNGGNTDFLIRKKEPVKKWVPFDLTKEEDRARLRGAWVRHKKNPERENLITGLGDETVDFAVYFGDVAVGTGVLLENFEFVDGSPCGKLVEEE